MSKFFVVGLGNIGDKYQQTRHNVGFWFVDALAAHWQISFKYNKKVNADIASYIDNENKIIYLIKPHTYMNLSGQAVASASSYYKVRISSQNLIVIHDELDLAAGIIKIKHNTSTAGHNGLRSLNQHVGGTAYTKIRIGISRPIHGNISDYVLNSPSNHENMIIHEQINSFIQYNWLTYLLNGKLEYVMNKLHS